MRDRDSQLIFESYNKRVLVREQAAALALPAVEGLGTLISAVAGTAAGALILKNITDVYNELAPGAAKDAFAKKIETLKSFIQSDDTSPRAIYEMVHFVSGITSNSKALEILNSVKESLETYSYLKDNMLLDEESADRLLQESERTLEELYNFAKKTEPSIEIKIKGATAIKAAKDTGLIGGGKGGGGGQPPNNNGPGKTPPAGKVLGALGVGGVIANWAWNNKKTVTGVAVVALAGTAPEVLEALTKKAVETMAAGAGAVGSGVLQGGKSALGLDTTKPSSVPQPKPTPSFNLDAPIRKTSSSSPKKSAPRATPDPYSADL